MREKSINLVRYSKLRRSQFHRNERYVSSVMKLFSPRSLIYYYRCSLVPHENCVENALFIQFIDV